MKLSHEDVKVSRNDLSLTQFIFHISNELIAQSHDTAQLNKFATISLRRRLLDFNTFPLLLLSLIPRVKLVQFIISSFRWLYSTAHTTFDCLICNFISSSSSGRENEEVLLIFCAVVGSCSSSTSTINGGMKVLDIKLLFFIDFHPQCAIIFNSIFSRTVFCQLNRRHNNRKHRTPPPPSLLMISLFQFIEKLTIRWDVNLNVVFETWFSWKFLHKLCLVTFKFSISLLIFLVQFSPLDFFIFFRFIFHAIQIRVSFSVSFSLLWKKSIFLLSDFPSCSLRRFEEERKVGEMENIRFRISSVSEPRISATLLW